jgi:hypothetical protein
MVLNDKEEKQIIDFVKKEPRTIQDVARYIGKSWVTCDTYVNKIKDETGQIDVKVFREGTQGALKIVFYNYSDSIIADTVQERLFNQIKNGRFKEDFDFMDVYQYISEREKTKTIVEDEKQNKKMEERLGQIIKNTEKQLFCFSGNLSFINSKNYDGVKLYERLLENGANIKILCRMNEASLHNVAKVQYLLDKYPNNFEIRHCYHPLRGVISDDKIARFKNEVFSKNYKENELLEDVKTYYEISNKDWLKWLEKVFWNLFIKIP